MKTIGAEEITVAVEKLCMEANYFLGEDIVEAFVRAKEAEESLVGKDILARLIENAEIARNEQVPMCQDTGMAVVWVEIGQDLHVQGGLTDAINEGVRRGYTKGYLRKSIVKDPTLNRVNTGDNTPAVIHYDIIPGDELKITVAPKGFGSENMGGVKMCKPSEGIDGVINFVVDAVDKAGSNPCPPIVVGIGVGGDMERQR